MLTLVLALHLVELVQCDVTGAWAEENVQVGPPDPAFTRGLSTLHMASSLGYSVQMCLWFMRRHSQTKESFRS